MQTMNNMQEIIVRMTTLPIQINSANSIRQTVSY